VLRVVTAPALEEIARCGEVRRLDEAAAALRSGGRRVRLVALSRSGEWERERMGAWLGVWKRKKGGPAVGKARGQRRRAHAGGPDGGNRGGREAADRWGPVTVLAIRIKSNRSKTIQTNLNSNQTRANFILSKLDLHKL
jgi:hypothetical protein